MTGVVFGSLAHRLRSAAKHPHMDNSCKANVFDVARAADALEEMREALEAIAKVADEPRKDWSRHVGDIARAAIAKATGAA